MNGLSFTMWLQGWVELNGGAMPTKEQWEMIKEHLALSFTKVTKPLDNPPASDKIDISELFKGIPSHKEFREYPQFDQDKYWLGRHMTGIPPGTLVC